MTYAEKRRDAFVAGTEYYDTEEAFAARVCRANTRRLSGLRRSLFSDTKANRKAYGHDSGKFVWTMPSAAADSPPWMAGLPSLEVA